MMDLIKPPTDNLYKFWAVSGLLLIMVGLIYPPWLLYQSSNEYLKSVQQNAEISVHREFATKRLQTLDARKQQAEAESGKLQQRLDGLSVTRRVGVDASVAREVEKLEAQLHDIKETVQALEDASHELSLGLALKSAQAKHLETVSTNESRNSRFVVVLGGIVVLFGLWISYTGFRRWHKLTVSEDAERLASPPAASLSPKASENEK